MTVLLLAFVLGGIAAVILVSALIWHIKDISYTSRQETMTIIGCLIGLAGCVLFKIAGENATNKIDELIERKYTMAQNAAITQHTDMGEIKAFNTEVVEAYSAVSEWEQKIFVGKSRPMDKLLIPYDEKWYNAEAVE